MRKAYLMAGFIGVVACTVALVLSPAFTTANANKGAALGAKNAKGLEESGKSSTAALLPVTQVVMFNSGVGYFQREGQVEGSQRVDLSFDTGDINDLIKSMTLQDLGGGQVSAVSYDSTAPIEHTLKSFAINLTGNPTFADILNQARGEKVEVVLQQNNAAQPANMTGSIIGVESKMERVKDQAVQVAILNLWCADGMRAVQLSDLQRIRFLNAVMDSEFRKALETLALGHDTLKKSVNIHFTGEGKRKVRVSYVVESPIWKSSYRLALNKDKKPFLQSWAVLENTTDEDWEDVRMALISGRPISFKMNLYDPLFIDRPTVEPELFASLRPPTYTGGLGFGGGLAGVGGGLAGGGGFAGGRPGAMPPGTPPPSGVALGFDGTGLGNNGIQARNKDLDRRAKYREQAEKALGDDLNLAQGVASAAQSSKLGDYHRYVIDHTITLPRQKSAMIPLVNGEVDAKRVSIFNESTHAKFPLLGLIFKNTTNSPLMQGPITVYEGSNYSGDARILDLQKGEQRLISYAIDLGTEVHAVPNPSNGRLSEVKIVKGILISKTKHHESKTYTIANRNEDARVMIVEHPHRTDFELATEAKPWETARDVYRFRLEVPAGKTEKLTVSEEKDIISQVAFTNSSDQSIKILLQSKVVSEKVKNALTEAQKRKMPLAEAQRDLTKLMQQLADLTKDQERLRRNIEVTPRDAKVYKRYLAKLDTQELEIEKLREGIKTAQDSIHRLQREYDQFLAKLTIE